MGLFELSRLMGTSVQQIDRTYGNALPDSLARARAALDSFLMQASSAGGRVEPTGVQDAFVKELALAFVEVLLLVWVPIGPRNGRLLAPPQEPI